ncbi:uncharacterized protein LOC131657527 [Vicia villosa]|uniref:uncharacterized protein LOC131657527 n=1 Tax=Vicia villosa TaxID=3911 RepID=UPI00273AABE6|nr:uncharacterized protein LOC131657527 [Vicia villosa]
MVDMEKSTAEVDLQERSTKKVKEGMVSRLEEGISFRDIIAGRGRDEMDEDQELIQGDLGVPDGDFGEITIEEELIGGYECPNFIFSEKEEKRIQRSWKRGVIVKLLGKRIGYKALENRLNQMWVKKGIISIIDLSNDYYLVAFSNEEDKKSALMNGPWFIYDHYLTVKEWRPNFQPETDTINEVAVWVRISGLPIEYYDARALSAFGDRIGSTLKVDKTTIKQERDKYARICVTVNLSKPLLAMLRIQGSSYKIEYEGLHLLCLVCGRYGHYKENCPITVKGKQIVGETSISDGRKSSEMGSADRGTYGGGIFQEGPWKIMQKQRRGRKVGDGRKNNTPGNINGGIKEGGSRFHILGNDTQPLIGENHDNNDRFISELGKVGTDTHGSSFPNIVEASNEHTGGKHAINKEVNVGRNKKGDIL